jgi:hypothetical protein
MERNLVEHGAELGLVPAPIPYVDLTNPQTLNLYSYVENNPLRYIDPTGHTTVTGPTGSNTDSGAMTALGGGAAADVIEGWIIQITVDHIAFINGQWMTVSVEHMNAKEYQNWQIAQQAQKPQYQNPRNESEARLSNLVYNETSSLRADENAKSGAPGSAEDLQNARVAIAEVAKTVTEAGHRERVAPSELTAQAAAHALGAGNSDAVNAHNAALSAARTALAGSNATNGATQYRVNHRDTQNSINGRQVTHHLGPFSDAAHRGLTRVIIVAP